MKKFINLRTPLFIGFSIIAGIIIAYSILVQALVLAILVILFFLGFIVLYLVYGFLEGKKIYCLLLSSFFVIFCLFGAIFFTVTVNKFRNADLGNHICDITGTVCEVVEYESYSKVILKKVEIDYPEYISTKYKIAVNFNGKTELDLGDKISFTATLVDREVFYKGKFNCYDIGNKVKYSCNLSFGDYVLLSNEKTLFEKSRLFIKNTLKSGLSEEAFSVTFALLTGNDDYIETQTINNFRAAGVAHIFAVSGLHIGFLSTVLSFILSKLKINKTFNALFIVFCLIFYSGICGFSASSLRATIMCATMLFASLSGERYDGINSMGVALCVLLLTSPMQLFFAGFQLSFGVVFAILVMSNRLTKLLKFLPDKLASALATVISAQLASIPIMLAHFGAFSLISIIANLLFIPIVSIIFTIALVSVSLSGLFLLPEILLPLDYIINGVIVIINAIDFTVFMISGIVIGFSIIFYYLAFFVFSGMVNLKSSIRRLTVIALLICFTLGFICETTVEFYACKVYSTACDTYAVSLIDQRGERTLIISYAFSFSDTEGIKEITTNRGVNTIDSLVVLSGENNLSLQEICTEIIYLINVKEVYSYGEMTDNEKSLLAKSFPTVEFYSVLSEEIKIGHKYGNYLLNGKAFYVSNNNVSAIFCGDVSKEKEFSEIDGLKVNLATVYQWEEYLFSLLDVRDKATYAFSNVYDSAKKQGYLAYYLK